jgi:mono/diheme cytochrome c family protein
MLTCPAMRQLLLGILVFIVAAKPLLARGEAPPARPYVDGHARPRALLYNPSDQLLYVALSTRDQVVAIDANRRPARIVARVDTGAFPQALSLLPSGDVLVVCRYDAALGIVHHAPQNQRPTERYRQLPAGPVHGLREAQVHRSGRIFVSAPALSGVQVLDVEGGVVQTVATGLSPRALRIVADPRSTHDEELLLVSNFLEHSLDVFALSQDGRIGARLQRVVTQAAVQDFLPLPSRPKTLLLLSHEDRAVDRSEPFVAGMDSVVLALSGGEAGASLPFLDPGSGRRSQVNLSDRRAPLAKLDALAFAPESGRLAVVGAATDNVLVTQLPAALLSTFSRREPATADSPQAGAGAILSALFPQPGPPPLPTGNNPVAVCFLPDGRIATADRLSDTVSLLAPGEKPERVIVGEPARHTPRDLGEILFFSRALVPHNVATGERSLYACSGCHDDAHVDGRLHPARQNRFYSMTKTCRSIGNTQPYLFLGEVADVPAFAANLVATHAQGAERGAGFDRYSTTVRFPASAGRAGSKRLNPDQIRAAMTAYLAAIPAEPSPWVRPGSTTLPAPARAGLAVFKRACASCHRLSRTPDSEADLPEAELERSLLRGELALTSPGLHDVGIKLIGPGGNNAPSLRGVWDNAPYFSDGSARTLEDVLARSSLDPRSPQGHAASGIPEGERAALLAFLRCL